MNIKVDNQEYQCYLGDDGSLDTIIEIDGIQHRFMEVDREEDGSITENTFIDLCTYTIMECIETDNAFDVKELSLPKIV